MLTDAGADSLPLAADAAPVRPPALVDTGATDASMEVALQIRRQGAAVSELQLQCPERCVQLDLAANGGVPPYAYSWDDGASSASRVVCPDADTTISASVRDALGHTATAELPVQLAACKSELLCLANPSIEGTPTRGAEWLGDAELSAKPWSDCRSARTSSAGALPRVVDAASGDEFPMPTDGNTYLYLPTRERRQGFVGQALCAPMEPGNIYYLRLDLAYAAEDSAGVPLDAGQLEIYGAQDACSRSELLWASPPLHTALRTYCVALQPKARSLGLVLSPTGVPATDSAVFVDHLIPVSSCP